MLSHDRACQLRRGPRRFAGRVAAATGGAL